MKVLILKEKKIPQDKYEKLLSEFKDIYSDLDPQITTEERDLSDIPYMEYREGKRGIDKYYIQNVAKTIPKYKYDHIVFLVHEDDWVPSEDGIWGWNLAWAIKGFDVSQVRFDVNNPYNSLGTFYHEIMHGHDQIAYRVIGKNIAKEVLVKDWDKEIVHGNHPHYKYIGSINGRENIGALEAVADTLKEAYAQQDILYKVRTFGKGYKQARESGASVGALSSLMKVFRTYLRGLTRGDKDFSS